MIYNSSDGLWVVDPEVVQHPADILLKPTVEVKEFGLQLSELVKVMFESMTKYNGCGLAANQLGVGLRLAVMRVPGWPEIVMVNPHITKHRSGTAWTKEGCLSVKRSQFWIPVKRSKVVDVEYLGLDGKGRKLKGCADLLGRCVQHELDHLDGLTCLERSGPR